MRSTEHCGGSASASRSGVISKLRYSPYWGIGCLVTGIGVFSLQDLIIKLISGEYPVHQVLTIRSLVAMPVLLALVAFDGGLRTLASRRAPALIFRSVL